MFGNMHNKMFGYRSRLHCLRLLGLLIKRIYFFLAANIVIASIVYFVGIHYSEKAFSLANYLFSAIFLSLLLDALIFLFLFLLACCEMVAEYLACLLFPR